MFRTLIKYIVVALGPVLLAWGLGYFKLPETTAYLDYSTTSSRLLQIDSSLRKNVSISVGNEEVSELFLYSLQFINDSGKNFPKTKVSFQIQPNESSQLISTSLKGPENYSQSLISEVATNNQNQIAYTLEMINIAGEQNPDYFTANFLFAGQLPDSILPTTHSVGTEFRPYKNSANQWLVGFGFVIFISLYVYFLFWMNKRFDAQFDAKKLEFKQKVQEWLSKELALGEEQSYQYADFIEAKRKETFHPGGWLKRKLKEMLSE
ncbi:hypothetical protein CGG78_22925 [Vibrio parahaemolyticus]|uniref:hypothetical protein n=4 Tax=Vibrio parahaemolyticus TaxID=670 RepID=UPI00112045F4|nr:hypothetical protein [Vibrio parahaemolyticus]ELI5382490.1 hypothetical protein [Vibrio parahaemolyticus]MBE3816878.1 hypothetical protein [Vibrio parahaemolyticus]MBE3884677.1 hypothetical protein [Vibrio parahaemolyticus]MBE4178190.1 hypothetical protein [Vibrio parahaemolyticus]MBE4236454.1 hypothetical protein [Vibrio parahaemolyticus]